MVSDLICEAVRMIGSEARLAAAAGYSQHAIWKAKKVGRVSAEMAIAIERATYGHVSKEQLRPDLFPPAKRSRRNRKNEEARP
ncbi:MAG: YdaS family helix-turn-helix protein [Pseudomonadota bacterium]